jgi:hypothetical protein
MKIPEVLLQKWNDLKSHGDGKKIAEESGSVGITKDDISRAFKNGECSDEVFEAIAGFYKEKEEKVKQYLT